MKSAAGAVATKVGLNPGEISFWNPNSSEGAHFNATDLSVSRLFQEYLARFVLISLIGRANKVYHCLERIILTVDSIRTDCFCNHCVVIDELSVRSLEYDLPPNTGPIIASNNNFQHSFEKVNNCSEEVCLEMMAK